MAFQPQSGTKIISYTGGTFNLKFIMSPQEQLITSWSIEYINTTPTYTVSITSTTGNVIDMTIRVSSNTTLIEQICSFYLVGDSVRKYYYEFNVTYNSNTVVAPIWEDTYFVLNNTPMLDYNIVDTNGTVIYSGKAVALPSTPDIKFNINRFCKDYLNSHLNGFVGQYRFQYLYDYSKLFYIVDKNKNDYIAKFTFFNSYAYKHKDEIFLNEPIKQSKSGKQIIIEVDKRQYLPISVFNKRSESDTLLVKAFGESSMGTERFTVDRTAQFVMFERARFNDETQPVTSILYTTDSAQYGVIRANIIETNYDYCLYYVNSFGGWDYLLIKGTTKKTDKITSQYYTKDFDNKTQEFEKIKYLNTISSSYTLNTDWFTDEEQSRLHNLIESTEVYLHNLNTDEILPVNITNTSLEYKTYTNNGKKKFNNTISVEVAQEKTRK